VAFGRALGRGTQIAIIIAAVITAVDQIGIDSRFLTGAILVVLATFLGGSALAFGLGARSAVSNIIAVHYVRQSYRVGQRVRLAEQEGTIREITATAIVLETAGGRVFVPAKEFTEKQSTLLTVEG
jgi:small-conductance mechanosensitive channel